MVGETKLNLFIYIYIYIYIYILTAVKNSKLPEFSATDPLSERISNSVFKAILKYENHKI